MYVLGINAVFHDSAACILKSGKLIAAAEEERFTQIKHGKRPIPFSTYELPFHAIDYCLAAAGIHLKDVDRIAYSFNPGLLLSADELDAPFCQIPFRTRQTELDLGSAAWDNLFLSAILNAPNQLADGWPHHLQKRFYGARPADWEWDYIDHHEAHAASAFYPSPFDEAAIFTLDGRGEKTSTTYGLGSANEITQIAEVPLPHSLGLLYENVTSHLGFLHSSDEYKVMALASYGRPDFIGDFREMIEIGEHGQYRIRQEDLTARFGLARKRHEPFTSFHFNLAHSLQYVLEESVLDLANWLQRQTGQQNLVLAGGVALNCVLNARIRDRSAFKQIWIQPAAGDSGTALGAALVSDQRESKSLQKSFVMDHVYWGPEYSEKEIEQFLNKAKIPYRKMDDPAEETAELLAADLIVGWFQGRMEFGPRALGSRSILASPRTAAMQSRLNEVKDREDFRPVAPVVLEEDAPFWFKGATQSPFMLFVHEIRDEVAHLIPAVRHVDNTARIQTINAGQHPQYYALLTAFKEKTGIGVLVNTSFNTLGKPIVCSPRDAIECFWGSPFDALVMGPYLILKSYGEKNIGDHTDLQETNATFLLP